MVQASALLQLLWILCSQKRPGGEWEHFEQNFLGTSRALPKVHILIFTPKKRTICLRKSHFHLGYELNLAIPK